jgi:hypothetical protein
MKSEKSLAKAAARTGIDEKTARKYNRLGKLPSELKVERNWRTRSDPFVEVWDEIVSLLKVNSNLEGKTLFEYLQRKYPGEYSDGQLRTLQRRIKQWRALEGPRKEVFFAQKHRPGELCQSDFTSMGKLNITLGGQPFDHMIYHFVLTYSNWESATICFSESFESLSEGLQNALWELGGIPVSHQTDRLSAAVSASLNREEFTDRYAALLRHYGLKGRKSNARAAHENGDIEQRHHRFKRALDQALLLRGSRDFRDRAAYSAFLDKLLVQLNAGRQRHFAEEVKLLRRLPASRLDSCKRLRVKVGKGSSIRVLHNTYSVDSRLIGEWVQVRAYVEHLEVWYAQKCLESLPRLRGEGKHHIQYRHIIDWLVRKPGAFENYRYKSDLFPTHRFRMAYDALKRTMPTRASKEYLKILHLAARESEVLVDGALDQLLSEADKRLAVFEAVKALVEAGQVLDRTQDVEVDRVDIAIYDALLTGFSLEAPQSGRVNP